MSTHTLLTTDDIAVIIDCLSAKGTLSDADITSLKRLFSKYTMMPQPLDVALSEFSGENPKSFKWPAAGFAAGTVAAGWHIGDSPEDPVLTTMWEIVEKGRVDPRYFISSNAARGMIRRADKMGRHLFGPLRTALERLAAEDDNTTESGS
jgi:hypothetical protein